MSEQAKRNKVIFDRAIHAIKEAYDFKTRQEAIEWLANDDCLDWVNMEIEQFGTITPTQRTTPQ